MLLFLDGLVLPKCLTSTVDSAQFVVSGCTRLAVVTEQYVGELDPPLLSIPTAERT